MRCLLGLSRLVYLIRVQMNQHNRIRSTINTGVKDLSSRRKDHTLETPRLLTRGQSGSSGKKTIRPWVSPKKVARSIRKVLRHLPGCRPVGGSIFVTWGCMVSTAHSWCSRQRLPSSTLLRGLRTNPLPLRPAPDSLAVHCPVLSTDNTNSRPSQSSGPSNKTSLQRLLLKSEDSSKLVRIIWRA